MDAIGNDWNTAPACVLSTVWGTASVRDLAVEVGAVPASPIRQVFTSRQASCAGPNSPRARKPVDLWTTPRGVAHKSTGPTAAADNLNLKISSVRTTPGSRSQAALFAYTRVLTAVHKRKSASPSAFMCRSPSPKKRLGVAASPYTILQILSLTLFEKIPLDQLLNDTALENFDGEIPTQLTLFS
jgi:hypothetical protein